MDITEDIEEADDDDATSPILLDTIRTEQELDPVLKPLITRLQEGEEVSKQYYSMVFSMNIYHDVRMTKQKTV